MVGNVQRCAKKWKEIGAPELVVKWIESGVELPLVREPDQFCIPNRACSEAQSTFIDNEIAELLEQGVIRKCDDNFPVCISPIGTVPKKGGSRLITDLRRVNEYCDCSKLCYEDINTVKHVVKPNDYIITVDVKSGYHHLPVAVAFQKYLGIRWNNTTYVWQRLPFGLNSSAYFFVKAIRAVVAYLRLLGVRLVSYVDDFIVCARVEEIEAHRDLLVNTLHELGITVNVKKSVLTPSTTATFIGYVISTNRDDGQVWLEIPGSRIRKLRHDIARALRQGQVTARALARIGGQCISMVKAILPGKLLLRNLYRLLKTRTSWQDTLVLDQGTRQDLEWWMEAPKHWNGVAIQNRPIDLQMETDASFWGWGAQIGPHQAQGIWNKLVSEKSSNYRELLTVLLALLSLVEFVKGRVLQILSDNVTTVCYINMQGGPSSELTTLATAIWAFALEHNITISAKHLRGIYNVRADTLSRLSGAYEWRLHPTVFQYIDQVLGPHTIDCFASMVTAQLPKYNSRFHDPLSSGIDAFAQTDWHQHVNFINPPIRLLPRILQTLEQYQAEATIIAPWWPAQPWFRTLQEMAIGQPLKLPHPKYLCQPVHPKIVPEPCKNPRWRLFAWKVSTKHAY